MNYYIWKNTFAIQTPYIETYTKISSEDMAKSLYTKSGEKIEDQFPLITFTVNSFGYLNTYDSLWRGMPYWLFSSKLIKLSSDIGINNIQYFPTVIKDNNGQLIEDYKIANIIGSVPCLDKEQSNISYEPGSPYKIKKIEKLEINESLIPSDLKLFRLKEARTIVVADVLVKNACEKASIKGVDFIPINDYQYGC